MKKKNVILLATLLVLCVCNTKAQGSREFQECMKRAGAIQTLNRTEEYMIACDQCLREEIARKIKEKEILLRRKMKEVSDQKKNYEEINAIVQQVNNAFLDAGVEYEKAMRNEDEAAMAKAKALKDQFLKQLLAAEKEKAAARERLAQAQDERATLESELEALQNQQKKKQ